MPFISYPVSMKNLFKNKTVYFFKKVTSIINNHLLAPFLQRKSVLIIRKKQCAHPKITSEHYMSAFLNRLTFKHNLRTG